MICNYIRQLVNYGLQTGLVEKEDEIFTMNSLLEVLGLDEMEEELFQLYLQYHFAICERSDCVGVSHHILDIHRKEG